MNARARHIDWDGLTGLFRPGRGAMPPKLAGRESAQAQLATLLSDIIKRKRAPTGDAVLYGPRGSGKTVLLDAFILQCKGADVISLVPTQIKNEEDLAALLIYEDHRFRKQLEEFKPRSAEIDLRLFSFQWGKMNKADRDDHTRRHLVDLLVARCHSKPLVVTLDEAHTLDQEVGRTLLNASQLAQRKGARFLLALAGTPSLRAHLNQMQSTFWNRSTKIRVGRLDAVATRVALEEPLENFGIAFDEAALETVITESQHYPYFIQIWGEVLCGVLAAKESTHIDFSIVDAARRRFTEARNDYYKDRYQELDSQDLLAQAQSVAGLLQGQNSVSHKTLKEHLEDNLSMAPRMALAVMSQLSDLGLIWQPTVSNRHEPGIPSLMTYVLSDGEDFTDERTSPPTTGEPSLPKP